MSQNYLQGVFAFVMLIVVILFSWVFIQTQKDSDHKWACRQDCSPQYGKMIDDECFCKTESGWIKPQLLER